MHIFKMVMGTLSIFFFSACSNTPEEAIHSVYDGIKNGDMVALSANSSDKVMGGFTLPALRECSVDKSKYTTNQEIDLVNDCLVEKYSNLNLIEVQINAISNTEAEANITVEQNSYKHNYQLKLTLIKNRWKVVDGR